MNERQDADFGDPRLVSDQGAGMLFGMNAGNPCVDQRPDQQFQPPALEHDGRIGIEQNQLMRRQRPLVVMFRIVLQNEVAQFVAGKSPDPVRVDELRELR